MWKKALILVLICLQEVTEAWWIGRLKQLEVIHMGATNANFVLHILVVPTVANHSAFP